MSLTIKNALLAAIGLPDVMESDLQKAAIDNNLSLEADYTLNLKRPVDIAAISVLRSRLQTASFSEGGVSYSINSDALKQKIILLAQEHGLTGVIASIKGSPKVRAIRNRYV